MKYLVVLIYVFSFGIADCLWVNVNRKNHELVSMLGRSLVTTVLFIGLAIWIFIRAVSAPTVTANFDFTDFTLAIGFAHLSDWDALHRIGLYLLGSWL